MEVPVLTWKQENRFLLFALMKLCFFISSFNLDVVRNFYDRKRNKNKLRVRVYHQINMYVLYYLVRFSNRL